MVIQFIVYFPRSYWRTRIRASSSFYPHCLDIFGAHAPSDLDKLDWNPHGNSNANSIVSQDLLKPLRAYISSNRLWFNLQLQWVSVLQPMPWGFAPPPLLWCQPKFRMETTSSCFSQDCLLHKSLSDFSWRRRGISQVNINCRTYTWISCFLVLIKSLVHFCQIRFQADTVFPSALSGLCLF